MRSPPLGVKTAPNLNSDDRIPGHGCGQLFLAGCRRPPRHCAPLLSPALTSPLLVASVMGGSSCGIEKAVANSHVAKKLMLTVRRVIIGKSRSTRKNRCERACGRISTIFGSISLQYMQEVILDRVRYVRRPFPPRVSRGGDERRYI